MRLLSPPTPHPAVEFLWSHTTESMCVGYMSAQDSKAKVSFHTHSEPHVSGLYSQSVTPHRLCCTILAVHFTCVSLTV